MRLLATIVFLVCASFASAQGKVKTDPPHPGSKQQTYTYDSAYNVAVKENKPLVVYIGYIAAEDVRGCISVLVGTYPGHKQATVLVALPDGKGGMYEKVVLPPSATETEIRRAAGLEASQSAVPFEPSAPQVVDGDDPFRSLRDASPSLYKTLVGMEQYTSAKYAQQPLSRTRRFGGPFFHHIPRTSLERKWLVAGGLENAHGWRSVLLRDRGNRVTTWTGNIDPNDGISEIVHQRSYVKATFADVLLNADGEVFEVRFAVKDSGRWERFTAWRAAWKAPRGYARLKSSECVSCHQQAGSGVYNTAYVPGGDTVISEPLAGLE